MEGGRHDGRHPATENHGRPGRRRPRGPTGARDPADRGPIRATLPSMTTFIGRYILGLEYAGVRQILENHCRSDIAPAGAVSFCKIGVSTYKYT